MFERASVKCEAFKESCGRLALPAPINTVLAGVVLATMVKCWKNGKMLVKCHRGQQSY